MNDVENHKTNTGLASHAHNNKHHINFDYLKILDAEGNTKKRRTLKALHIARKNNTMNFKEDANEVNKFYRGILKDII